MRTWKINILLSLIGVLFSVSCVELLLRLNPYQTFGSARELDWVRCDPRNAGKYILDPEFGFRPLFGSHTGYSEYGTKLNSYKFEKTPGVTRLLFIGDSVTDGGYIIDGLKEFYGGQKFEYWSAGVSSFNTAQEVNYYKKYNYLVKPDHVILTFHENDFDLTPVAFFNSDNRLVVFSPSAPATINGFWFQHSIIYRALMGAILKLDNRSSLYDGEVVKSLTELRDTLLADGIRFTVIINPTWLPAKEWNSGQIGNEQKIVNLMQALNIRYFSLKEVTDQLADEKVDMQDRDQWHPSRKAGFYAARYLFERKIL